VGSAVVVVAHSYRMTTFPARFGAATLPLTL
jgi:hypothetical protein